MKRGRKGGTLGFVVASAITLILLAICFFFVTQLIGGGREHVNAIDAACLNVAKFGLTEPNTTLDAAKGEDVLFAGLGDDAGGRPGGNRINLRNYNRLFAQAALIAINAEADGTATGKTNANDILNKLQTGDDCIADRLTKELSKTSGNVLFKHTDIAKDNSVRMLGKDSSVAHQEDKFRAAFLEQDRNFEQATNIFLPPGLDPAVKDKLDTDLKLVTTVNGKQYIRGYEPVKIGSLVEAVGVPVQPGRQPHLVSRVDFRRQVTRFDDIDHSRVPPNGFETNSAAGAAIAQTDNAAASWSIVGSQNREFGASIPLGYIEIINGVEGDVPGPFPGNNTWIQNEGAPSRGTAVSSNCFGDANVMAEWKAYHDAAKTNPTTPMPSPNPPTRIWRRADGGKASTADAAAISSIAIVCNDGNTKTSPCDSLWNNGKGKFDAAMYPGGNPDIPTGATSLTAVECADCQVEKMFNAERGLIINGSGGGGETCRATGLRVFGATPATGCTPNMATSPKGTCRSTREERIRFLGNYASRTVKAYPGGAPNGTYGDAMMTYITAKLRQIKPYASDTEINNFITFLDTDPAAVIPLGARRYIFMQAPNTEVDGKIVGGDFILSPTPPPVGFSGVEPDGSPLPGTNSISYKIERGGDCGLINPTGDFGIHAIMYYKDPTADFTGTDTAILTRSSGYKNNLGRIEFRNAVVGSCALFSDPD